LHFEMQIQAASAYNFPENKKYQVTSGFYDSDDPVFDPEGKYLYFLTQQTFKPIGHSQAQGQHTELTPVEGLI